MSFSPEFNVTNDLLNKNGPYAQITTQVASLAKCVKRMR